MIDYLVLLEAVVIDILTLQGKLHIETGTTRIRILHPPPLQQSPLEVRVPTDDDEHPNVIIQPLFLLPLLEVGYEGVGA